MRALPSDINSECLDLNQAWAKYAHRIVSEGNVLIPDTDEDLNWHTFLGHSIDMQGFRAAEFAGVDSLSRPGGFVSLEKRKVGIRQLAELWDVLAIRSHLLRPNTGLPMEATYEVLRKEGGAEGISLAEAFETFPFRKGHWTVRALLQNSATLSGHEYSFRRWLIAQCADLGIGEFPPRNFRQNLMFANGSLSLESALCLLLEKTFYRVGPQMSAYMLCDWQLALWYEDKTGVI